ncbi:MAG: TIGR00159 family protein [Candidatus Omnitrophica bacterium]|nr:TIGR00159 family protein [Candidatus Omnitrophota bacterium]
MNMFDILSIAQKIRISDITDIGIITVFIYLILVWFKKSRARLMLLGMVILSSIYILARIFNLYLTTMVFQAFLAVFLIALVVIFQEDIRYFFERLAVWSVSRRHAGRMVLNQDIDALASAMANLSRKRIGALIVIRGNDPLDRHLEVGTTIDALLNQDLLESIFDPHVPTHDGAVIVEGGRLIKFGCHLPLSVNLREISRFGTRHAAALGLAERTDAFCIISSEERGIISVAEAGNLVELSDVEELKKLLIKFYQNRFPVKKRSILTGFFTTHLLEKIIAVILAAGLWVFFGHRIENVRRDLVIPVEYRNLASDKIVADPKPKDVTITLSGSERAFDLLKPSELKLSLDMSALGEGEHKFPVTKKLMKFPVGLSLVNAEPEDIILKIYKLITYTLPVSTKTEGSLPRGLALKQINIDPKEVALVAPTSIPKETIKVTTEAVDLRLINETVTFNSKLLLPAGTRLIDGKPIEVKITVEIEKRE